MLVLLINYVGHCLCQVHPGPDAIRDPHPHYRQTHSQTTSNSCKRNLPPTSWPFLVLGATGKSTLASSMTLFFTSNAMAPHTQFLARCLLTIPSIPPLLLLQVKPLGLPTSLSARRGTHTSSSSQSHATNLRQPLTMCIRQKSMTPPKVSMQSPFATLSRTFAAHMAQFPNPTLMTTRPNLSPALNLPSHLLFTQANRRSIRRLPKTPAVQSPKQ